MLLSSMDHLNYYPMSKDNFLQIDTSAEDAYALHGMPADDGLSNSPTYMNEENSPKNGTKSSLYKTELCKRFSEFGNCRYGAKCQFAHGVAELRHVVRHPKYKTTKCKSYWGSGHCPYGSRCRFIHEETEGFQPTQFSPPGGLFLHEKDLMNQMTPPNPEMVPQAPGGFMYGDHEADHLAAGVPTYQKDFALMSSFDKATWAPRPQPKLTYAGDQFHTPLKPLSMNVPAPMGAVSQPIAPSTPSYPDLQDAIDALMKFSLSPSESEQHAKPLGTITSKPTEPAAALMDASVKKPDYSLDADALWKDFPSLDTTSDFTDKLQGQRHWPASGLGLNLDNGFEAAEKSGSSKCASPSSGSDEDDESRRLSVFERFH